MYRTRTQHQGAGGESCMFCEDLRFCGSKSSSLFFNLDKAYMIISNPMVLVFSKKKIPLFLWASDL